MPNVGTHWLDYIKMAAVQAVEEKKPCNYVIGTVVTAKPLKIKLSDSDGLELTEEFFHLARNVTDFETTVTITDEYGWKTKEKSGGGGDASFASHDHDIAISKKKIKIHNALKKGDKVLMIQKAGGQDYIIIDRVVS